MSSDFSSPCHFIHFPWRVHLAGEMWNEESGKKHSWKNTPLSDHKPDILPPEREKNAASRGMNSGLEARNSLFLIHAVTQTVFTTGMNYLVCFSIFPFLTFFFSKIIWATSCFRTGEKRVWRDGMKNSTPIFSLPSSFTSFLALLISAATERCLSLWDGHQHLPGAVAEAGMEQGWSRDMWYSLPAAKDISFTQRTSSSRRKKQFSRRKSSCTEMFDDSLGANLGWCCLKQH